LVKPVNAVKIGFIEFYSNNFVTKKAFPSYYNLIRIRPQIVGFTLNILALGPEYKLDEELNADFDILEEVSPEKNAAATLLLRESPKLITQSTSDYNAPINVGKIKRKLQ